jgi:hypothetical protein
MISIWSIRKFQNYLSPQLHGVSFGVAQQVLSSPPQLHSVSISLPRSAAPIIAHAHPTPLWTSIACTGQLSAHAPHSMQDSGWESIT